MLRRLWEIRGVIFWAAMFILACAGCYAEPTWFRGLVIGLAATNARDAIFDWRER